MTDEYTISQYSGDKDGFVDLHDTVFGSWNDQAYEQFKWKYIENPFFNEVSIITAKYDGETVGARGMITHQLSVNHKTVLGFQGSDAMVHPAHRRKGIYSRIFQRSLSYCESKPHDILFGFPASAALQAHRKNGCTHLQKHQYLKGRPLLRSFSDVMGLQKFGKTASSVACAAIISVTTDILKKVRHYTTEFEGTIQEFESPPVDILTGLYQQNVPDQIHTIRSAQFYEWRLREPMNDFTTYVSFDREGEPICGIITSQNDNTTMYFRDILPLNSVDVHHLYETIRHIIEENENPTQYIVWDGSNSMREFVKNGFVRSYFVPYGPSGLDMYIYPICQNKTDEIHSVDITDERNWLLHRIEKDH